MTSHHRCTRRRTIVFVLVASLVGMASGLSSSTTAAARRDAVALEPGIKHFGRSYNELAGAWWSWAVQFPLSDSPITAHGDTDCSRGQAGKIWFLAGNFGGAAGEPNPTTREVRDQEWQGPVHPTLERLFFAPEDGGGAATSTP